MVGFGAVFTSIQDAMEAESDLHHGAIDLHKVLAHVPVQTELEVPGASKVLTHEVVGMEGSDLARDHFFLGGTTLSGKVGALFLNFVEE